MSSNQVILDWYIPSNFAEVKKWDGVLATKIKIRSGSKIGLVIGTIKLGIYEKIFDKEFVEFVVKRMIENKVVSASEVVYFATRAQSDGADVNGTEVITAIHQ